MTDRDRAQSAQKKELEDKALKVQNGQEAAQSQGASPREKADLKLMQQELQAEELNARRRPTVQRRKESTQAEKALSDRLDDKLDSALEDSFPGSDPVSFLEATPVQKGDRDLMSVKATTRSQPKGKGSNRK